MVSKVFQLHKARRWNNFVLTNLRYFKFYILFVCVLTNALWSKGWSIKTDSPGLLVHVFLVSDTPKPQSLIQIQCPFNYEAPNKYKFINIYLPPTTHSCVKTRTTALSYCGLIRFRCDLRLRLEAPVQMRLSFHRTAWWSFHRRVPSKSKRCLIVYLNVMHDGRTVRLSNNRRTRNHGQISYWHRVAAHFAAACARIDSWTRMKYCAANALHL